MPKKKIQRRRHEVKATLDVHGLSKAGSSLILRIYSRGQKLGELVIGRGSLFWYGRSRHKRKRISWSRFGDMMDELAYGKGR